MVVGGWGSVTVTPTHPLTEPPSIHKVNVYLYMGIIWIRMSVKAMYGILSVVDNFRCFDALRCVGSFVHFYTVKMDCKV